MNYDRNKSNVKNITLNLQNKNKLNFKNNENNNYNLNITQQLINYIYSTVELSRFKYKIIEYESDLNILTKQKHFLSANFNGTNCLLVFTKIRDKFYSFMVDRKTLTYNQNQIKFDSVKIMPVNIRLDNNIYNGTIMDGIYIQNKRTNGKIFVITDIYYFNGKNLTNDDLKHKFMNVTAYLESNLKVDDKLNNIKLTINRLYEPTEILKLITDMEKSKGFDFKGYIFYPSKSGTKLIFLNNDNKQPINKNQQNENLNETELSKLVDSKNTVSNKKKYIYICKTNETIYATLEIRKTLSPDVYNVFCTDKEIINGKNCLKLKKLGIALVPDKTCSSVCKNIFNTKLNGKALMKCKFNSEKNKWIPIEEDKQSKYPNLLSDIEKNLELIVESESDEENDQ